MNPNAQRIAIAESQGWTYEPNHDPMFPWRHRESKTVAYTTDLPDYLNDLNAMHEAEESLSLPQAEDYAFRLKTDNLSHDLCFFNVAHKKAGQRAEAFLKTLDLWEKE